MTNREKIEAMTVKELFTKEDIEIERFFLGSKNKCDYCKYKNMKKECDFWIKCPIGVKKWLDQEAKDD